MSKSINQSIVIAACAGLLVYTTFLAVRFKAYLDANDQGICWLEKRKLPIEEMRIRALKTYVLQHKTEFDNETRGLGQRYSYWRIIKQDYDGKTVFKLGSTFHRPANGYEYTSPKIFDSILKVEDFDFRLYQDSLYDDIFYKKIIENNYMLVASYESYLSGLLLRIGSYKLHERSQLSSALIPRLSTMDKIHGFGFHYFSIQSISIDYRNYEKNKSIGISDNIYAISNCGNLVNFIGNNYSEISEATENQIPKVIFNYKYIEPHYPIFTLFTTFIEFLKGA